MVVTISREYGAAGLAVAQGVAALLDYEFVTLPAAVATKLGTSREEIDARSESDQPLAERILRNLGAGTAEVDSADPGSGTGFDETVRREVERALREAAARGNVVILGRAGHAVLAGTPGLVRVFLTAPRDWRIERLMETFDVSAGEAGAEVDRLDAARRRFVKDRYNMAWGDARNYDMTLDTSRFGIDGTAAVIAAAVKAATA